MGEKRRVFMKAVIMHLFCSAVKARVHVNDAGQEAHGCFGHD